MKCPNCSTDLRLENQLTKVIQRCDNCGFMTMKNDLIIDCFYAYLTVDPTDNNEGLAATSTPSGIIMPLVTADKNVLNTFDRVAQRMADNSGIEVRRVLFSKKTIEHTFKPSKKDEK
jgi:hypothetical protein